MNETESAASSELRIFREVKTNYGLFRTFQSVSRSLLMKDRMRKPQNMVETVYYLQVI